MVIYKITNKINGKIYIGQTHKTANKRFHEHLRTARTHQDAHGGARALNNAIRKYGEENFYVEVIDEAESDEELNEKERLWIDKLNSTNSRIGYNIQGGGISGKKPKSTRKKIGKQKKKDWEDKELAERMLAGLRKGTEVRQQKCRNKRVEFTCPVCGKKLLLAPYDARSRQYCSQSCARTDLNRIRGKFKKKEPDTYALIREEVDEWCKKNAEIIQSTPYNKIRTMLKPIMTIANKYGIYDWRTLSHIVSGYYGRKDLLSHMKQKYMLNQSE